MYVASSPADVGNYSVLKAAILARYDINTEAYRRRFRTATRGREESFREPSTRLMDLQNKWLRECTTMAQMKEIVGLEQLLEVLYHRTCEHGCEIRSQNLSGSW